MAQLWQFSHSYSQEKHHGHGRTIWDFFQTTQYDLHHTVTVSLFYICTIVSERAVVKSDCIGDMEIPLEWASNAESV